MSEIENKLVKYMQDHQKNMFYTLYFWVGVLAGWLFLGLQVVRPHVERIIYGYSWVLWFVTFLVVLILYAITKRVLATKEDEENE